MENKKNHTINGLTLDDAIRRYEPMVHHFVKKASTNHVCSKEDLAQEGRLAIVMAFRCYNPDKGASLTTWTYHMIKDALLEYQKHHLSILSGGAYLQSILKKAGEDASIEQIMDFGVSKKTAIAATYINDSYSSANYDDLSAVLADERDEPSSNFKLEWQKYLTDQEVYAVSNFYGFGGTRMTLNEIGENLGKSRKSVSYMINKALVKLRHIEGVEEYMPV